MSPGTDRRAIRKSLVLAATVLVGWSGLACLLVGLRIVRFDTSDPLLSVLAIFAGLVCWVMLLWALHHLTYQLASLFHRTRVPAGTTSTPGVAILYTTRDDFSPNCCRSCLDQDYPEFRVLVCDDSQSESYQTLVAEFCGEYPARCELIRRPGLVGFKAGNLNHALDEVHEEWVLLVDADQELAPDYLRRLVSHAPEADSGVGFVQAAQETAVDARSSDLEQAMAPGATSFCQRDLPLRNAFGFVPMLGHGTLIPTAVLRSCGGFPQVVSEDFAFAMQAARRGLRGLYVPDVVSRETFPHEFAAFVIRLRKYASGTAQLFRQEIPGFLFAGHRASLVERWDLLLMLGWYVLMPLLMVNGFVAAYVCHRYGMEGFPIVSPLFPYLFTWLILATYAVLLASSRSVHAAWRFAFWSSGLFVSVLPLVSWAFAKHLFRDPEFERTPKNGRSEGLRGWEVRCTALLGIVALILSLAWYSPYSFVLAGQGLGYLSFPLYAHLGSDSTLGRLARASIHLPGLLFLVAVGAIWYSVYTS